MSKLIVKIRDDDNNFPCCPLEHEGYCHLPQTHYRLGNALLMQGCLGLLNKRPPWCPLKPMLQKKSTDNYSDTYGFGWNDCIDEIIGDENG